MGNVCLMNNKSYRCTDIVDDNLPRLKVRINGEWVRIRARTYMSKELIDFIIREVDLISETDMIEFDSFAYALWRAQNIYDSPLFHVDKKRDKITLYDWRSFCKISLRRKSHNKRYKYLQLI